MELSMTTQMIAQPIPTPDDFPISWDHPDDAMMFWQTDPMHFPDPYHPLEYALAVRAFAYGFNRAAEDYDLPIRAAVRRFNSYFYQSFYPLHTTLEEHEALGRSSEQKLGAAIARLAERWQTEQLPEIQRNLDNWRSYDLHGAALDELIQHFDTTVACNDRTWEIHFQIAIPMLLAMSMFSDMYSDLFGEHTVLEAFRLLQGFDNKSLESDRALWELSRKARLNPIVRETLAAHADHAVMPMLARLPAAQDFLNDLRQFLETYGHRSDKFAIIALPSWIEDATPVIKSLKNYIGWSDYDPIADMQALASQRESCIAEVRARLVDYPQPVVEQFEVLLRGAQAATVLQEDHNYWLDQCSLYEIRRVMQELGRRLCEARAIADAEDVFYLTLDELRHAATATPIADCRHMVAERKAEMEHFRRITPPPTLGTLPAGAAPDNPVTRAITRFFGGQPRAATEPNTLCGSAGSAGVVRGVAKVVRSLAEASKLGRGDILVAETTAPPWTALFAIVDGVVTDTGGILSHCAVVAREYRIPAVVGTGVATRIIQDGQILEVDGNTGTVRIVDDL
jgi:phosphohistidine swiveling domain-containing protein